MKKTIAFKIKRLIDEISPLIESFTEEVCHDCKDPCCRQRFGIYEKDDMVFLKALDEEIIDADRTISPEEPCQFLSSKGCIRPRWLRPFRCTWFFCLPLLQAIEFESSKDYRRLVDKLNLLKELRTRLLEKTLGEI